MSTAQATVNTVEPAKPVDAVDIPRVADLAQQRWSRRKTRLTLSLLGAATLAAGAGVWWMKVYGLQSLLPLPKAEQEAPKPASSTSRGKPARMPDPGPAQAAASPAPAQAPAPAPAAPKPTVPAPDEDIEPICIKGQPCNQRAGGQRAGGSGGQARPRQVRDPRDAPMMVISGLGNMLVRVADSGPGYSQSDTAAERARLMERLANNQRQLDRAMQQIEAAQNAPAPQQPGAAPAAPAAPVPWQPHAPVVAPGIAAANAGAAGQRRPFEATVEAEQLPNDSLMLPPRSIECSMLMKVATAMPGDFRCMVTRDVRGADGQITLIDRGSIIYGRYNASNVRIGTTAIALDELWVLTPAPYSVRVRLDAMAAGPLGEGGVQGRIDNRWGQRVGPALFLSVFSDAARALIQGRDDNQGNTVVIGTGALNTGDRLAQEALRQTMNIPSILTKNQGDTVFVETLSPISFQRVYQLRATRAAR
ncbi:TrbI/VirB10 family protein [Azohydromonas australica]|uniref:TrbI/VirB10 family protein n=1 Tax=Azohydromonas australica TaxID=364039 RepID=UPI0005BD23CD|nr:TrbI/VirB10 family protein [Azohydromonas australica]